MDFYLKVSSPISLFRKEDMLRAVNLHTTYLPEYLPQRWGWYEPLSNIFNPDNLDSLFVNDKSETIWWDRKGKHRADGRWMTRWVSGVPTAEDTHSSISVDTHETVYQSKLIAYLKKVSLEMIADIGFLDGLPTEYKPYAIASVYSPFGTFLSHSTHVLRHWLPDMPWAAVFGPAYVRMFGKEKLLSCPAYKVEDIGPEYVYIQLTSSMDDIYDQYELVMDARDRAKGHLGRECFFNPDLAYDYRKEHEKAGKVFRVPEFELIED